jgi:hypothetical protein
MVEETRELPVPLTNYLLAYTVVDTQLTILAVQHSAQGWPEAFWLMGSLIMANMVTDCIMPREHFHALYATCREITQ